MVSIYLFCRTVLAKKSATFWKFTRSYAKTLATVDPSSLGLGATVRP
jgi:hypothetical protein